jgi:hypothetical protein
MYNKELQAAHDQIWAEIFERQKCVCELKNDSVSLTSAAKLENLHSLVKEQGEIEKDTCAEKNQVAMEDNRRVLKG